MKKNNAAVSAQNERYINAYTSADAGFTFTVAVLVSIAVSVLFSIVISAIANSKGLTAADYGKQLQNGFIYYVFAYGLSSVSVLIALLISSKRKNLSFSAIVPFKKFHYKYLILAAMLAFGMLFGLGELNNIFVSLLEKLGYAKPAMTLPNDRLWKLAVWLIVAGALPAFLEECLFRGYILSGLKEQSVVFTVLIGGLAFSLFHQNPQQTPYQFVCGAAFFLIALRSGSVWPSVLIHFANNAVVLISNYLYTGGTEGNATVTAVLTALGLLCFAAAAVYLIFFDKNKPTDIVPSNEKNALNHTKKGFFIYSFIGFAACLIMWVADLLTYMGA